MLAEYTTKKLFAAACVNFDFQMTSMNVSVKKLTFLTQASCVFCGVQTWILKYNTD